MTLNMPFNQPVHLFQMTDDKRTLDPRIVRDDVDMRAGRVCLGSLEKQIKNDRTVLAP